MALELRKIVSVSGITVLASVAASFYFKIYLGGQETVASHKDAEIALSFRTICTSGSAQELLPYEFHKREGVGGSYADCSAIIKLIDPAKDDYKTSCKLVISDIIKSNGNDHVELTIFDDYQAYVLSAIEYDQNFKVLSAGESDTVNKHTVAIFYGNRDGDEDSHTLFYYPGAQNQYTEKELFFP